MSNHAGNPRVHTFPFGSYDIFGFLIPGATLLLCALNYERWFLSIFSRRDLLTPVTSTLLTPAEKLPAGNVLLSILYSIAILCLLFAAGHIIAPGPARKPGEAEWMAVVHFDPKAPGALARAWFERGGAGTSFFKPPATLKAGDYVEHGVKDRRGRKTHDYFRVLVVSITGIVVREAGTPAERPPSVARELAQLDSHAHDPLEDARRHVADLEKQLADARAEVVRLETESRVKSDASIGDLS